MKRYIIVGVVILLLGLCAGVVAQTVLYGVPPHMVLFPLANGASTGEFRFLELFQNGSNYVALKAPNSLSGDVTLTLPATAGTSGQLLRNAGNGTMEWWTLEQQQPPSTPVLYQMMLMMPIQVYTAGGGSSSAVYAAYRGLVGKTIRIDSVGCAMFLPAATSSATVSVNRADQYGTSIGVIATLSCSQLFNYTTNVDPTHRNIGATESITLTQTGANSSVATTGNISVNVAYTITN